ncbi:MAG: DNA-processing protein DprA [Candidatus Aminicenantaceae bacterium]
MEDNRKYWVAFNLVLASNLKSAKKIFEHFPSIRNIFEAGERELIALGLKEDEARRIVSPKIIDHASRVIEKLERKNYTLLTLEDKSYPNYLREIFDPPFVLYCAGKLDVLEEPSVSIVGARRPTPYGKAVTERLAEDLASRGVVIVSGMARGIDSMAHWGALKRGKTVAVLGSGLEDVYPRENYSLLKKITERGAVISEFPLDTPPLGFHFPIRNRIISGLSMAVIVVEAAKKSGSLISARLALEQNREVMAVPGNVTSDLSQGTNWLIKTGAKLVENWEDVAEELPSPFRERIFSQRGEKERPPSLNAQEKKVFECLKEDTLTHIDELVEKTVFSISELLSILLTMELKGIVSQSPGKYFQRKM